MTEPKWTSYLGGGISRISRRSLARDERARKLLHHSLLEEKYKNGTVCFRSTVSRATDLTRFLPRHWCRKLMQPGHHPTFLRLVFLARFEKLHHRLPASMRETFREELASARAQTNADDGSKELFRLARVNWGFRSTRRHLVFEFTAHFQHLSAQPVDGWRASEFETGKNV